jgi:hypothetical protein
MIRMVVRKLTSYWDLKQSLASKDLKKAIGQAARGKSQRGFSILAVQGKTAGYDLRATS